MNAIKTLVLFFAVFLVVLLSSLAFTGAGYFLTLMSPFSLFQGTVICLAAAFVFSFIIITFIVSSFLETQQRYMRDYDDEEHDDEYEDADERFSRRFTRSMTIVNPIKTGRNEPCPCGSGKKYKYCCGKN